MDGIRERWRSVHGRYPDSNDVDEMFKDFIPTQMNCLQQVTSLSSHQSLHQFLYH
jgi:hypothetical protein